MEWKSEQFLCISFRCLDFTYICRKFIDVIIYALYPEILCVNFFAVWKDFAFCCLCIKITLSCSLNHTRSGRQDRCHCTLFSKWHQKNPPPSTILLNFASHSESNEILDSNAGTLHFVRISRKSFKKTFIIRPRTYLQTYHENIFHAIFES